MKLRLTFAAATCLALPIAAHAQPVTGPYVSLEAGTSIGNPADIDFRVTQTSLYTSSSADLAGKRYTRPALAGDAAVGYGFGNGWRVQLDGDFLRNTIAKINAQYSFTNTGATAAPAISGKAPGIETTYGPMVNALYDMNIGLPVFPYVGAGVGYQWATLHNSLLNQVSRKSDLTQGSFAFDAIAGLSYPLPMVPGLSLTAEYRFMMLTQTRTYYRASQTFNGYTDTVKGKVGQESSHTFMLGVRYQLFNAPAPAPAVAPAAAPMAAPAPAPARTYLVFFDWDKATLTPRATQIIAQAASDSKTQATTTIDVNGYTDTSGTPAYNQGLSVRRAKAVAAQLVTDGVPASEITVQGFGDTKLLVPTGPGVREPQNRRVEIILN
ncbi:membrane protein [Acidocella aquatica]|uniref:Membrane protein n=1 Tax=Acidocella aquatica TaxID=1922313 RepID=A0ABQ6ABV9_9PROT|nr:OmpA family protein [Acidocella aquatica]GLR68925.1 membrane protein [Acidocella aquatica]